MWDNIYVSLVQMSPPSLLCYPPPCVPCFNPHPFRFLLSRATEAQSLIKSLFHPHTSRVIDFHDVICSLARNERIKFDCHFWISDSLSNGYIQSELQLLIFFHRFESRKKRMKIAQSKLSLLMLWCFLLLLLATAASALNGDKRKPILSIAFLTWTCMYSYSQNVCSSDTLVLLLDTAGKGHGIISSSFFRKFIPSV